MSIIHDFIQQASEAAKGDKSFIQEFIAFLKDPTEVIKTLGYPVLMLIIFAETGLLIGFFLPGDSLLVTTGFLINGGYVNPFNLSPFMNLLLMNVTLMTMAIVGDAVGFAFGSKTGPALFKREQSFLFRKDRLLAAQRFYEKHGGKTIIMARFVPFLRTFAPIVAGIGKMPYRRFAMFNIVGGVAWVLSMTFLGYFLGKIFDAKKIEKVVYLVILLSVMPLVIGWIKNRLSKKKDAEEVPAAESK
jgi:membrane-associated protein